MIEELKIGNFRGFRSLHLQGLKPVNLIVGHNNAGKTSLLEAILVLCQPQEIGKLLSDFRPSGKRSRPGNEQRWLFHDNASNAQILFQSAPLPAGEETGIELVLPSEQNPGATPSVTWRELPTQVPGRLKVYGRPLDLTCRIVSVHHRPPADLVQLVGKAHRLKDGEETLQRLLATIDPRIRKIRVDPGEEPNGNQIIVDLGLSQLIPLTQAGQGVYRLVTILADLIGERPKVLLIDEIENGLHHSVLEEVWKGIAEAAAQLGVQVFATTHSGECLSAAHRAFARRDNYDLSVIQLFRLQNGIQGRVLDQRLITAGIDGEIELR